jgi:hypothetical protein
VNWQWNSVGERHADQLYDLLTKFWHGLFDTGDQ